MPTDTSGKTRAEQNSPPAKDAAAEPKDDASHSSEHSSAVSASDGPRSNLLDDAQSGEFPEEIIQLAMRYAGPLPPPGMLKQYNDALPDGADRIVSSWEWEGQHRRKLQNRGQLIAAGLGGGSIVAAVICALFGQAWVAGSIVGVTMLAMGASGAIPHLFTATRKQK